MLFPLVCVLLAGVSGQPQAIGGRCRIAGLQLEASGTNRQDDNALSREVYAYQLTSLVSQDLGEWTKIDASPFLGDIKKMNDHIFTLINGADDSHEMSFFNEWWYRIYHWSLLKMGVAFLYNKAIYYMADFDALPHEGTPLVNISITTLKGTTKNRTTGDHPLFYETFSAGYQHGLVYLAGGAQSVHANTIYTLDLDSLHWTSHVVTDFVASTGGCIAVGDGFLVHMLGQHDNTINQKAQVINTTTWQKVVPTKEDLTSPFLLPLSVLISILVLLLLSGIAYYFYCQKLNFQKASAAIFIDMTSTHPISTS